MVVNGATKRGDMAHFDAKLAAWRASGGAAVAYEYLHTQNLVALQGPAAPEVLAGLVDGGDAARTAVKTMPFMSGRPGVSVAGVPCTVTRCGYTGEDGYEIGMAPGAAATVARALLADARVLPSGLSARDSLRLEAGLCLYGNDIDGTTTPNEAGLIWTVAKARREGARANFPGAARVLAELKAKSWTRRRVGLTVHGPPAREGAKLYARPADKAAPPSSASPIGVLTSGSFSPILNAPLGMGYVAPSHAADGTAVAVEVRGKLVDATVTKMPFVPNRYYRGAA
jgi:aminomethyltransferase